MKQIILILIMATLIIGGVSGQVNIQNEATGFFSYGLASEDQMLPDTFTAAFTEKKNGLFLNSRIIMSAEFQNRYDYQLQLSSTTRSGASYLPLQLPASNPADFSLSLDSIWWRLHLSRILIPDLNIAGADLRINARLGKFGISAMDASVSGFGLEGTQSLLSLPNTPAVALESTLIFPGITQLVRGVRSNLTLSLVTGGLFDETIQRLYDGDGGIANHGRPVVGEFAPQFMARLALNNFQLPFGELSAGAAYSYNAGGIYSGHGAGGAATLDLTLVEGFLILPLGLSLAYYQKNLDVLAGYAGTSLGSETTSLRETIMGGFATGIRFIRGSAGFLGEPKLIGEATISGAYSRINHIYREPLNLVSLGIDGRYFFLPRLYVGGGFMLGALSEAEWKTSDGIPSSQDDFQRVYRIVENLGYEVYLGVDVIAGVRISLGFANLKGLSMNHGLESIQNGMIKLRQSGTEVADMLWETKGLFILTTIRL